MENWESRIVGDCLSHLGQAVELQVEDRSISNFLGWVGGWEQK